jgi:hypothetical protein
MKRLILSAAIAAAFAATTAIAQEKPQDPSAPEARQSTSQSQSQSAATLRGTVSSVDQSGKSFVIKDEASGKETTVYWDSSTKMSGDLKPGSMVTIQTTDAGGRVMATSISIASAKKPY